MPCAEELPLFASRRSLPVAAASSNVSAKYRASARHSDHFASARTLLLVVAVVGLCCLAAVSHKNASARISALEQTAEVNKVASPSAAHAITSNHVSLSMSPSSVEQQIAEGNKEMKDLEAKVARVRQQQKASEQKDQDHHALVAASTHEQLADAPASRSDSYLKSMDRRTSMAVAATSDAVSSALTADQLAAKKALKAAILAEKFKLRAQQKEKNDMEIVQRARERELEDQKEERKAEIARKIADRVAAAQRAKAAKDVANRLKEVVDSDIAKTRKDKAEEESAERAAEAAQHTADLLSSKDNNVVRAHSQAPKHQSHRSSARHTPVESTHDARGEDKKSNNRAAAAPTKPCDPLTGWAETLC